MTDDEFATPGPSPRDYVPRGDAEARAKVPRDQWDRYLMPHLDGTKVAKNKGFTRVSTIKSGLSNQTGIKVWTGEKIIEGLGQDTQLVEDAMRAATIVDPQDRKRALRKIADRAFVVGGGKDRSGKGTEFHELTENVNRGTQTETVSPYLAPELSVYQQMLIDNNVQILPDMLERQVLCPYNAAGTFDNMVRWWNPDTEEWELCIADLKTGRDLSLGWLEILMQLWSYANAYGLWTTTDVTTAADGTITDVQGFYEPMPLELRKDKALIFHVPLDGTATLYVLDLSGVERYVAAAVEAKRANAEAKHKVRKVATVTPAAFVEQPGVTFKNSSVGGVPIPNTDGTPWVAPETTEQLRARVPGLSESGAQAVRNGQIAGLKVAPPPTADQIAQLDKRNERLRVAADTLARVSAMSNPNTDGDDDYDPNRPATTPGGGNPPPPGERDPVTGRKKRTCGHCRKPGHTQKNCPENPASPKFAGDVGDTNPPPADPAAQAYVPESELDYDGTEDPNGRAVYVGEQGPVVWAKPALGTEPLTEAETVLAADWADGDDAPPPPVRWSVPGQQVTAEELTAYNATVGQAPHIDDPSPVGLPYCHLPPPHTCQWTSTNPAAPGQWVCATTGKPSREVWDNRPNPTVIDAQDTISPLEQEAIRNNPAVVASIAPPAWAAPHPSVNYTAVVLGRIEAARTQAELLRLRSDAIEAGHWVETVHNDPAMARYQALA